MINFKLSATARSCETYGALIGKVAHRDALIIEYDVLMMQMHMAEENLEYLRRLVVYELRSQGQSWAQIAGLLGVSRQAAWERYSGDEDPFEGGD